MTGSFRLCDSDSSKQRNSRELFSSNAAHDIGVKKKRLNQVDFVFLNDFFQLRNGSETGEMGVAIQKMQRDLVFLE